MTHEQLQAAQRAALSLGLNVNSEQAAAIINAALRVAGGTPSATWRAEGLPDPHGERYNCERAGLCMGSLTDDQLANGVFLFDHRTGLESIAWLTAAKDRIRWLSRKLEESLTTSAASQQQLTYTTHAGESLMGIANRELGGTARWEEIRDLNAERFPGMGPHDYYPVGTVLDMPASASKEPSHG